MLHSHTMANRQKKKPLKTPKTRVTRGATLASRCTPGERRTTQPVDAVSGSVAVNRLNGLNGGPTELSGGWSTNTRTHARTQPRACTRSPRTAPAMRLARLCFTGTSISSGGASCAMASGMGRRRCRRRGGRRRPTRSDRIESCPTGTHTHAHTHKHWQYSGKSHHCCSSTRRTTRSTADERLHSSTAARWV